MVTDKLANAAKYYDLGKLYEVGLKYLENADLAALPVGRYEVQGEDVFVLIQEYEPKPLDDCKWEAHKLYADIQYIISGGELMGYAPVERLTGEVDHTPEKDVLNYTDVNSAGVYHNAEAGDFFIFMPHDGHCPCVAGKVPVKVKKAVVKVRVL